MKLNDLRVNFLCHYDQCWNQFHLVTTFSKWYMNRFLVVVNWILIGFFQNSMYLRWKRSFFPLLFILVMEAFGCLLKKVGEGGLILGLKVGGRDKVDISSSICWQQPHFLWCWPIASNIPKLNFNVVWGNIWA